MRRPVPRFLAVSAACVLVFAGWLLLPGRQSTAEAFNAFAHSIVSAKTARFKMEIKAPGQPKLEAEAYFKAPSHIRQELKGMVNISDMEAGKIVSLNPATKQATVVTLTGRPEEHASLDLFERLREFLDEKQQAAEDYRPVGERVIDGRRALGFRCDTPMGSTTIWGDPQTGLPVRIDSSFSGVPKVEVAWTDFRLNVELQDSLFDTTPPADYTVQSFDMDASPFKEDDLLAALRIAADWNDGRFPDAFDTATSQQLIIKAAQKLQQDAPAKPNGEKTQADNQVFTELMPVAARLGRGFSFALQLPESADAHYAGKEVAMGAESTPIFWYRSSAEANYRVIHADLTVHDAATAPQVPSAVRIGGTSPPEQ